MKERKVLFNISIILFILICCSGFSFIMPWRIGMIALFGLCVIFCHLKDGNIYVLLKNDGKIMFVFILLMFLGLRLSYDKIETSKFICIYIAGLIMIIMPMKSTFNEKVIKGLDIAIKVISISIIVNAIIPGLFKDYLYFFISGGSASVSRLANEVNNHIYSGLMGEKGEAAYIMVIGLIILLSKCIKENKISNSNKLWLFIYIIALLLPAKRMLFIIAILICIYYIVFWTKGRKKILIIMGFFMLGIMTFFIATEIPTLNTLVSRFTSYSDDATGNGRTYLWEHAINMFSERKWFGYGYGSYNAYASDKGVLLSADRTWVSQAHNIYYQLLGEMGIIGTVVFILLLVNNIVSYVKLYFVRKKMLPKDLSLLFIGSSILILTIIYGYSGNCIYYTNQIMLLFFSMTLCSYMREKYILQKGDFNGK